MEIGGIGWLGVSNCVDVVGIGCRLFFDGLLVVWAVFLQKPCY